LVFLVGLGFRGSLVFTGRDPTLSTLVRVWIGLWVPWYGGGERLVVGDVLVVLCRMGEMFNSGVVVLDDSGGGEVESSFRGYCPDVGCPWVRGEGEGLLVCISGRVVSPSSSP
jgi:hypothetical protein